MPDEDAVKVLEKHLDMASKTNGTYFYPCAGSQAKAIIANPQAHVDVLVQAGVLRPESTPAGKGRYLYSPVSPPPPHEHDWRWNIAHPGWVICTKDTTHEVQVIPNPGGYRFTDMPKYDRFVSEF